ncbi:hypothetical protein VE03_05707 [Pseudogymnoascus sp. 23342-1-I1]|nr:hypothetical protein VE03_05707 [Pseudogymnoascus sp. 23342-1-I1]
MATSPFPASFSKPGEGHLIARLLPNGISGLVKATFQYPLKIITPPSPVGDLKSALAFLLTYGGGLVAGDQVNLKIDVHPSAKLTIATQGHTKVFKSASPTLRSSQTLTVILHAYSALCLLPDPVQPFADSVYVQSQIFTLHPTATLCLLDWVTAGRTSRNESWDFTSWSGRNEVWRTAAEDDDEDKARPRLLLRDNLILDGDSLTPDGSTAALPLKDKMHALSVFGTLILAGPLMAPLSAFFLAEFSAQPRIGARDFRSQETVERDGKTEASDEEAWRARRLKQEREDGVLWSAAKVRGCTVVKFGSKSVEGGRKWVGGMILRQGGVVDVFGEDAVMCVR